MPLPPTDPQGAYRVRRPRPTDALGGSLRQVFAEQQGLPNDMKVLLAELCRIDE